MSATLQYLKTVAEFSKSHGRLSIEGFILERGKSYERKPLPDEFEYGPAKECYGNAFRAIAYNQFALGSSRYVYCEGYAYTPGLIPCPHAWLVDKEDNKVIDVTWRDGGRECAFCCGTGAIPNEDEESEEDEECWYCHGSGEQNHEHPSREGCEYFGIEFEREAVISRTIQQGFYGILEGYASEQLQKEEANA